MEIPLTQCCICGNFACEEESDHSKVTPHQFSDLLKQKAGFSPQIAFLKKKIQKAYDKIRRKIDVDVQPYKVKLSLYLDKLHFWHLLEHESSLKAVQAAIFGYTLPRNQLIKLIKSLQRPERRQKTFPYFKELIDEVHKFKRNYRNIIENHDYDELYNTLVGIILTSQKEEIEKRQKKNTSSMRNAENEAVQIVTIQGIPFCSRRAQVDLSVLEVRDKELFSYIPALQKMKDLKQLSIGNNHITRKGFRVLFNTVKGIESINLRNSNSDYFVDLLCDKLPNLKSLYCCETGLDDHKLLKICESLSKLKLLYVDENNISGEALWLGLKILPKMMYLSAKEIEISQNDKEIIQFKLVKKGGYFWN